MRWWRCGRCGQLTAHEYILGRENPYKCIACGSKHLDWTPAEPQPHTLLRNLHR